MFNGNRLAVTLAVFFGLVSPAFSEDIMTGRMPIVLPCGPHDAMKKSLGKDYKEQRSAMGISVSGRYVIELYESAERGTFTLLVVRPDGTACTIMGGEGWQADTPKKTSF